MSIFRMFRVASFAYGAYRTYRRYRGTVRASTKHALKRARRSL